MKLLTILSAALTIASGALAAPAGISDFHELMRPHAPLKRAAESLQQVTDFGSNPTDTLMYIYVPATLATKPPIIVAIHYCTGTADAYFTGTEYASLADQKGFIVIYPQSPYSGTCWDVSSQSALTHDGGGDSNSIANMVTYALDTYSGDSTKVFVTGTSSGAMMTNVMAATYPELFAAGIVYSGVPAGCFYSSTDGVDAWNSSCAEGDVIATSAVWAQIVDNMYPGYTGSRPKMEIYHGSADTTLYPQNYNETIKQWCGVFGYDYTKPETTQPNVPLADYTTYTWGGGTLIGVYAIGVGHTVPVIADDDMVFFGLSSSTTTTTTATGSGSTSTSTSTGGTSTSTSSSSCSAEWGQCGGEGWTGATCCVSGTTCTYSNAWYSQCLA